jgi:1-acyl-sn-glycerol-3-phosphate acyltransferase
MRGISQWFEEPMIRTVRRLLGMVRVVTHLARGVLTMLFVLPHVGATRRRRIIERWSRRVLDIFGLSLKTERTPLQALAGRPLMLVGNHISWIDIYAYLAVAEVRFVAKSEVRHWPLIGWFSDKLGTIFVDRERPRDAVRVASEVHKALEQGDMVCLFPEGTTTDGSLVLPFQPALLSAAVEAKAVVQPVTIAYRGHDGAPCRRVAFTGDATLVASIWSLADGERSVVELTFHPVIEPGLDRRTLARQAESAVRSGIVRATETTAPASTEAVVPIGDAALPA